MVPAANRGGLRGSIPPVNVSEPTTPSDVEHVHEQLLFVMNESELVHQQTTIATEQPEISTGRQQSFRPRTDTSVAYETMPAPMLNTMNEAID